MYYTPDKLHKYGLRDTSSCPRCGLEGAGFAHISWFCHDIQQLWLSASKALTDTTDVMLESSPLPMLLGYVREIPKPCRRLIAVGLVLARRRIAMRWMQRLLPVLSDWRTDMIYCNTHSDNYRDLMPVTSRSTDIWGPFRAYLIRTSDAVTFQ